MLDWLIVVYTFVCVCRNWSSYDAPMWTHFACSSMSSFFKLHAKWRWCVEAGPVFAKKCILLWFWETFIVNLLKNRHQRHFKRVLLEESHTIDLLSIQKEKYETSTRPKLCQSVNPSYFNVCFGKWFVCSSIPTAWWKSKKASQSEGTA